MSFMFFLLGGILFLPTYLGALDCRLKEAGTFHPLQFFRNLTYVRRGRLFCVFGFSLIVFSLIALFLFDRVGGVSSSDSLKGGVAIFLVFSAFSYGYCKSALVKPENRSKEPGVKFGVVLGALFGALKDLFLLSLVVAVFVVVKLIKNNWGLQ